MAGENPRFRDALLFADLDSGQLISETVWRDPKARAASPTLWALAAVIRAGVLDAADCVVRAVEDYSLVFSSARGNHDVLPSWPVPAPSGRRVRDIPDASLMPGGRDPGYTGDLPDVLAWPGEPSWSHEHQHREPRSSHRRPL